MRRQELDPNHRLNPKRLLEYRSICFECYSESLDGVGNEQHGPGNSRWAEDVSNYCSRETENATSTNALDDTTSDQHIEVGCQRADKGPDPKNNDGE